MKRAFVVFERHIAADGKLFTDGDGCVYIKPHSHPVFAGKEFCNDLEVLQAVQDHNSNPKNEPFKGEYIVLPIITF
jgi:hypothetical protein